MNTFETVLFIVFVFITFVGLVVLIRSEWVFKKRTELNRFDNNIHVITEYINYDKMVFKFWIWDVEKMRIKKN